MMPSFPQILIVLVLVILLFGRGKISGLMGDVAKGIKSFKKGMADDDDEATKKVDQAADGPLDVTPRAEKKDA
jgi:sec-independent protein translocase protein TatA